MLRDDLLEQATHLAELDVGRPRQSNLRRAVSGAYYAMFHSLVHEACCAQLGAQHAHARYRHVLGRGFVHGTMKEACRAFSRHALPARILHRLPPAFAIPPEIIAIATDFVELQDRRHIADYDLAERFVRSEVRQLLRTTRIRIAAFANLPPCIEKRFFLACLWAWRDLSRG